MILALTFNGGILYIRTKRVFNFNGSRFVDFVAACHFQKCNLDNILHKM